MSASSQPTPDLAHSRRSITVTGEAEILVTPDEVKLGLGVETFNQDLPTARRVNDEIVSRVLALIRQQGVKPKDVQTDYLRAEPVYQRDGHHENKQELLGYLVRKSIVLLLADVAQLESVLMQSLEAGANEIHGIELRTTELKRYRDEARALAVRAAQAKARSLAGELNQTVGEPLRIQEETGAGHRPLFSGWGYRFERAQLQNHLLGGGEGEINAGSSSFELGKISVAARIIIEFALV